MKNSAVKLLNFFIFLVFLNISCANDLSNSLDNAIDKSLERNETLNGDSEGNSNPSSKPGIVIQPVSGLATSESGDSIHIFIRLNSKPANDVFLDLFLDNAQEGEINASRLLFTEENWDQEQGITITGKDDSIYDQDQVYYLLMDSSLSLDIDYKLLNIPPLKIINADNDAPPSLAITGLVADESAGIVNITVTITGTSALPVNVNYATSDGSAAVADNDYTASLGVLSWLPGETDSKAFPVIINDDAINEFTETINLSIFNPSGGTISVPNAVLSIIDNDNFLPVVISATATANTNVKLTFNQSVRATTAECNSEEACSVIYFINGLSVLQAQMDSAGIDGPIVNLITSSQKSDSINGYMVTVTSGVIQNATGPLTCDSPNNTSPFTGNILPYILTASSLGPGTIDITYSKSMLWSGAAAGALNQANYCIELNSDITPQSCDNFALGTIDSISSVNPNTVVRLTTSSQQVIGTIYRVTVFNVVDDTGNSMDTTGNTATFTGQEKLKIIYGEALYGHLDKFKITFSRPVVTETGDHSALVIENWSFDAGLETGGPVDFCTSLDTADCETASGISNDGKSVYFKTSSIPDSGSHLVIGGTAVGTPTGARGCILSLGGISPVDCLEASPYDRFWIQFDLPTDPGSGPVFDDLFSDGITDFSMVFTYNGRLLIGPDDTESFVFQTEPDLTNPFTLSLDADDATPGNQSFMAVGQGVEIFYAACLGSGLEPTLTGIDCDMAGGVEYLFAAELDQPNKVDNVHYSSDKSTPFVFANISGLETTVNTRRATSLQAYNGYLYVSLIGTGGNKPLFSYTTVPGGTVVPLSGTNLPRVGAAGVPSNGTAAFLGLDSMVVYDNDGTGNSDNKRLYIANGGQHAMDEDGGIIRLGIETDGSPPVIFTGANGSTDWEDVTPNLSSPGDYWHYVNGDSGIGIWSKMLIPAGADWVNLSPSNLITPAILAIPKMAVFNGDLYLLRNACKTPSTDPYFSTGPCSEVGTCIKTCKNGDEYPQLWRLKSYDEVGGIAGSGEWVFIGNTATGRTDMGEATWAGGTGQAVKTANNTEITMLIVNGDRLYVGYDNAVNGTNIWRTKSGVSAPSGESDFEAICQAGYTCSLPSSQFGYGNPSDYSRIFHYTNVEDKGMNFVIFTTGNGVNPVKIMRTANQ